MTMSFLEPCLQAILDRARPWGQTRCDRVARIWPSRLEQGLVASRRPDLEVIRESTEVQRREDIHLLAWYVYHCTVEVKPEGHPNCIPCELCGRLTGCWCEGCDRPDHAICTHCDGQRLVCIQCPGGASPRSEDQDGMVIYAMA